jgi:chloramphenicol 3-O phosphotransferase
MATAVVLNGTSSSGKTTVARAFQERAPRVFLNFSIDSILYALPQRAIDRIKSGADISDLRLPELVRAFYACAGQLLQLGHDLVIDHAVTARYHAELLLEATHSHDVLLVGLDCPSAILRKREEDRGDRRPGLAELQQSTIHTWLAYDLVIDTSTTLPEDAAARIVEALAGGGTGAIARMRARVG